MNQHNSTPSIETRLRTLQMLVGALVIGVVTFAAIAAFAPQRPSAPPAPNLQTMLMVAVIGIMVAAMAVRLVLRRAMLCSAAGEVNEPVLFGRFTVWTLVTAALLEGAALLAVTVYFLTRDPASLVLAGAALLLLWGAAFPTRGRWEALVADATYRRD